MPGRVVVAVAALAVALIGCTSAEPAGPGDKAGGPATPTTLRLGTPDHETQPGAGAVLEFIRLVDELSNGQLVIEPVWRAQAGDGGGWDQEVAGMVAKRDLDLAMVPARAWDVMGITSLDALQAPLLVDSDDLVERIVSSDLATDMLRGLAEAGVIGLALVPESLRHPFSSGEPLLAPADYSGKIYRAPHSATVYATLSALGATPNDLDGQDYGSVEAADSDYVWAAWLPWSAVATGNVTLYAKLQSLVINVDALAGLSDGEREVLRQAAEATRDWTLANSPSDSEAARRFCAQGGDIALASPSDLAAIHDAVQPVYARLEQDPATRALIDRIKTIKRQLGPPSETVEVCDP